MTSPYGTGVRFPPFLLTPAIAPNVDPLLVWGYRWGNGPVGTPATVTYSFPTAGADVDRRLLGQRTVRRIYPVQRGPADMRPRQAMTAWSDVANITFVKK